MKTTGHYRNKDIQHVRLKAVKEGVFSGYANVFDVVDKGRDRIHKGAFAKNLLEQGSIRKLLWQHDRGTPIGGVKLEEDDVGLKVAKGEFMRGVPAADNALATTEWWLNNGHTAELSIGWIPVKAGYEDDIYEVREAKVIEVSVVSIAMNPASQITALKNLDTVFGKSPLWATAEVMEAFALLVKSNPCGFSQETLAELSAFTVAGTDHFRKQNDTPPAEPSSKHSALVEKLATATNALRKVTK